MHELKTVGYSLYNAVLSCTNDICTRLNADSATTICNSSIVLRKYVTVDYKTRSQTEEEDFVYTYLLFVSSLSELVRIKPNYATI